MESFRTEGKTILLVTHNIHLVKGSCRTAILLHNGEMFASGDPEYVAEQYLMLMRQQQTQNAPRAFQVARKKATTFPDAKASFGSPAGQILDVTVLDKEFRETAAFLAGDTIVIRIRATFDSLVQNPDIAFLLRDDRGYNIYGTSMAMLKQPLEWDEHNMATASISLAPVLRAGSYSLTVSLRDYYSRGNHTLLDKQVGTGTFQIIEHHREFLGVIDLDAQAIPDLRVGLS